MTRLSPTAHLLATIAASIAATVAASIAAPGAAAAPGERPVPGTVGLVVREAPVKDACAPTIRIVRQVKRGDDRALVAMLTFARITGLDVGSRDTSRSRADGQRFQRWTQELVRRMEAATRAQEQVAARAGAPPADRVVAAARIAQIMDHAAHLLGSLEVPRSLRAMPDAVTIYCEQLTQYADAMRQRADDARDLCRKTAADHQLPPGWWTPVCAAP